MDWPKFFVEVDARIAEDSRTRSREILPRALLTSYAMHYHESPRAALLDGIKAFSMLHQETLAVLELAARRSSGTVLEIGPFIGGSTSAIGEGLRGRADARHVIVEVGGAYETHPQLPTDDILRDLRARIAERGLQGTQIVQGWSYSESTVQAVEQALAGRKIDLLFIDSDGKLARDFLLYQRFLAPGCMLVFDDYLISEAGSADKQVGVRKWIAEAIDQNIVHDLGVYLWGTFAGQYTGSAA